jgi:DUF177 domain-containing protein
VRICEVRVEWFWSLGLEMLMPLTVNLRHLEDHPIHVAGQLTVGELDIQTLDEVIAVTRPLDYDLEIERVEGGLLLRGRLRLVLDCECVRCLKPFNYLLELKDWSAYAALQGEDSLRVSNDCVGLTALLREDTLLEFPRHPLCDPACRGLPEAQPGRRQRTTNSTRGETSSPAWSELDKLKF